MHSQPSMSDNLEVYDRDISPSAASSAVYSSEKTTSRPMKAKQTSISEANGKPGQKLNGGKESKAQTPQLTIPAHTLFGNFIRKHEIPRKVFHSSIGFLTLWLYTQGVQLSQVTPVLIATFVVILSSDIIRFKYPAFNKLYISVMGPLMREKEINSYNGVIFYLAGLIFVFSLFPKDISLISLLLLSWADTSASTFGRAFGHLTPKLGSRKSLAGSLAAFATGIICASILYLYFIPQYNVYNREGDIMWNPDSSQIPFPVYVLCCGFIGAFSEAIDINDVDDNLTIPVISAITLYFVLYFTESH